MAQYKQVATLCLNAGQDREAEGIVTMLNEIASLRDEPVHSTLKRLLREILPEKIAQLKAAVK